MDLKTIMTLAMIAIIGFGALLILGKVLEML